MQKKVLPLIKFKNKPDDEMLIGAYVEPLIYGKYVDKYRLNLSTEQVFDDLKECGFNTLLPTESALNREENEITLSILNELSKRNMNFLLRDKNVVGINNLVTDKSEKELIDYFKREYLPLDEKYSAFAGLHYIDEPGWKDWKRAREIKNAFKQVFPDKLFYLNVLPVYSPAWAFPNGPVYMPEADWWAPNNADYIRYYESYIAEAQPEIFSYDYYPSSKAYPNLLGEYFKQLHLAYKYSLQADIPLVCFIQNGSWDEVSRDTTEAEMRWLINTALAYNTKGICYFTYWQFTDANRGMCIDRFGNKTPKYNLVKQFNKELKFISRYILNSAFCGFIMTGTTPNGEIPVQEDRLTAFGNISNLSGEHLFVGCFEYHDGCAIKNMYIAVNNSITEKTVGTMAFDKSVAICLIHRDKKEYLTTDSLNINLDAGDAYFIIEE